MDLYMIKKPAGFEVLPQDAERLAKLKYGDVYKVKVSRPRNIKFHRMFFGMLRLAFDNQDTYDNFDIFEEVIKLGVRHAEVFELPNGKPFAKTKSISFAKMTQDEFESFYDKVGIYIENVFNIPWEDLKREVEEVS
jgi:hypothetical protein